jgi:membrane protein
MSSGLATLSSRVFRGAWQITRDTIAEWREDNASRLAAALAYYTLLSLAPLLVIAVAISGFVFGTDAARGRIAAELSQVVGEGAAQGIQAAVASAQAGEGGGVLGTLVGVGALFFGASAVFVELQSALNTIWEVTPRPGRGLWGEVRDRVLSFAMVVSVAFLLLVSLIVNALLSALGSWLFYELPGGEAFWQGVNFAVSWLIITALFALILKVVPDAKVRWRDVWLGAAVTSLLFGVGKLLLGLYLGKAAVGSSHGAAGSLVALVVWVYYAAQIFFLGAEFTQVMAKRAGRAIAPDR